ncbi:MAG: GTP 3',8-cyclase MoaA [Terriglobia bacterium]
MPSELRDFPNLLLDVYGRPMRSLRISVTDRCNLRCRYCMPEDDYAWVAHDAILSFEEISTLVEIFTALGVRRLRLTGGEPLLRRNLDGLIKVLAARPLVEDLAITTNGVLLGAKGRSLRTAGLKRVTVSLDTLQPRRFQALTRSTAHSAVVAGIGAAIEAGFDSVKINTVVIRGFNDDEIADLLEFGRRAGAEVRFIEYMDVGGATRWAAEQVVTREEILRTIESRFGPAKTASAATSDADGAKVPADRFRLEDGTTFGIISSTSRPFCGTCDRSRLTTDGVLLLCLYAGNGVDLKALLRRGASAGEIARAIARAWTARTDRGAEDRRQLQSRGALFPVEELRKDLHREMHTRGG